MRYLATLITFLLALFAVGNIFALETHTNRNIIRLAPFTQRPLSSLEDMDIKHQIMIQKAKDSIYASAGIFVFSSELPLLETMPMDSITEQGIMDLAWDGSYLWAIDGGAFEDQHYVDKIDPTNGSIIRYFSAPNESWIGDGTNGIAYGDGYLWVINYLDDVIYAVNPNTGQVDIDKSVALIGFNNVVSGGAWDGQYLWFAKWGGLSGPSTLYQIDVWNLQILKRLTVPIQTAEDLEFINGYLFVSGKNSLGNHFYKLDPQSGSILESYDKNPCSDGIAFDGQSLWTADWCYHEYFLYQINVSETPPITNNPPYTPYNPSPPDGSTNQSVYTILSWVGGDPDAGDVVTYDVYFGADPNPPVVSNNQSRTTYNPGTLNYSTTYYWKIIARDNHGAETSSQIWHFTTGVTIPEDHQDYQTRPILLGTSGGNVNDKNFLGSRCCGGTLGALVTDGYKYYILSNNHVLARTNKGKSGEGISQPGLIDNACSALETDLVARLTSFVPIRFGLWNINEMDAAIAEIIPGKVKTNGEIMGIGIPSTSTLNPSLGLAVQKAGRTTGVTHGKIMAINATIKVVYSIKCGTIIKRIVKFANQFRIEAEDGDFSLEGDSGSLILEDTSDYPRPVGLLFAGGGRSTFATPINLILNAFGTTIKGYNISRENIPHAENDKIWICADVKNRYEDFLLKIPGIVGVGIGIDKKKNPTIEVYLEEMTQTVSEKLPSYLEGFSVKQVVTGKITPF
jgi:glutamine cyclotransferase